MQLLKVSPTNFKLLTNKRSACRAALESLILVCPRNTICNSVDPLCLVHASDWDPCERKVNEKESRMGH